MVQSPRLCGTTEPLWPTLIGGKGGSITYLEMNQMCYYAGLCFPRKMLWFSSW
jgi:hypothetical protein